MSERITWLLPVRNAMPYLRQTLASIAGQTYRNHEVLAWDDGSTDGSLDELRSWIPSCVPGRVIAGTAAGLATTLSNLVKHANTEWCARVDGDDVNESDRLETQAAFLAANPGVSLVGGQMRRINEAGLELPSEPNQPLHDAELRWSLRFFNAVNHPTVLFRRSAVLAVGNYREVKPGEDYDLWLRMAQRFHMANLPARLVRYRVHAASFSAMHSPRALDDRNRFRRDMAPLLFPGLLKEDAERLFHVVGTPGDLGVTREDIRLLHRAAGSVATVFGDNAETFRQCELYRRQRLNLATRWLKKHRVMSTAWPLLRGAASLFQQFPGRGTRTTIPMKKAA